MLGSDQQLNTNIQLIFNSLQLTVYIVIIALAIFKLSRGIRNQVGFHIRFYLCITSIAIIQVAMQSYEMGTEAQHQQPTIYILVIINIYSMSCEAASIFLLADYWDETKKIIVKQSTEGELKANKSWFRAIMISVWLVAYTVFIIYGLAFNKFTSSQVFYYVLTLGCQGLAVTFMIWAILLQIISGSKLINALGRYEQWLNQISMKKGRFRSLYWMSTFFNLIRAAYLVLFTIVMEFYREQLLKQWIAVYIYTLSNCPTLLIYIFGFNTKAIQQEQTNPSLLDGTAGRQSRIRALTSSSKSKNQTQLSQSRSSHQGRQSMF